MIKLFLFRYVPRGDGDEERLDVDVLAVHGGTDAVAEDQAVGVDVVVVLGGTGQ